VVTEYLDYLWELGELPVYISVVLALHGSQVAMVWPLPVPGDLQSPSRVDMGKSFNGHGFSRSKTRVDPTRVPTANFPYQGLLVQTYIQCHGSYGD
jgi:hypothetical protein